MKREPSCFRSRRHGMFQSCSSRGCLRPSGSSALARREAATGPDRAGTHLDAWLRPVATIGSGAPDRERSAFCSLPSADESVTRCGHPFWDTLGVTRGEHHKSVGAVQDSFQRVGHAHTVLLAHPIPPQVRPRPCRRRRPHCLGAWTWTMAPTFTHQHPVPRDSGASPPRTVAGGRFCQVDRHSSYRRWALIFPLDRTTCDC